MGTVYKRSGRDSSTLFPLTSFTVIHICVLNQSLSTFHDNDDDNDDDDDENDDDNCLGHTLNALLFEGLID